MNKNLGLSYLENEIIINENYKNAKQEKVYEEMQKFDLEAFLYGKGKSSGAICLITPNQIIMTDTFVRSPKDKSYGTHLDAIKEIYSTIYGKNPYIVSAKKEQTLINWPGFVVNDGNILFQLCIPMYATSLIWMPHSVTENQIVLLKNLNERIKQIESKNIDFFLMNPLIFEYIHDTFQDTLENNLDEIINDVKVKRKSK